MDKIDTKKDDTIVKSGNDHYNQITDGELDNIMLKVGRKMALKELNKTKEIHS